MNTHADKRQSAANDTAPRKSSATSAFQFVDNRPAAIAQRRLQDLANTSPRALQLAAVQERADSHTRKQFQTVQRSKTGSDADAEMKKALGEEIKEKEPEEDTEESNFHFEGDLDQPFIETADMKEMLDALELYMSVELDGIDPTPEHLITMGTGWTRFLEKFNQIMKLKHYGGGIPIMITKAWRTKKAQPEMPPGKTIPEIIAFVNSKKGEVCNQSVGGGILEILTMLKQPY